MELRDKLMADLKVAMVAKDMLKVNTIRFVQAAIKNREIDMRPNPITGEEVMAVFKKLVKQRKESIEQYSAAGRTDLVDQETAELKILEAYLPAQMGREDVEKIVSEVIAAVGATSIKDMGAVMKETIARTQGAADNKLVSEIIRTKLS
ncbi:MAG: GatB/YqeY domain-containing protein [Bdellovibrionia bacterium]